MGTVEANTVDAPYRKSTRRFFALTIFLPIVLVVARETIGGHTVLLRPAPDWVSWASYAIGLTIGLVLIFKFWTLRHALPQSRVKQMLNLSIMVPLAVVTAAYLGRWAFELAAFVDTIAARQKIELRIMNVQGGKSGTFVILRSSPSDREIAVKITSTLYAALAAIRPPLWSLDYQAQPYCITLESQFGRWGSLRARVPARWETGLNDYHTCDMSHRATLPR